MFKTITKIKYNVKYIDYNNINFINYKFLHVLKLKYFILIGFYFF